MQILKEAINRDPAFNEGGRSSEDSDIGRLRRIHKHFRGDWKSGSGKCGSRSQGRKIQEYRL